MLIECIDVEALESASGITRQADLSAEQAQNGDYLTSKHYEIVTKSDVNGLTVPGAADSTKLQIQDLPLGQRIATNKRKALDLLSNPFLESNPILAKRRELKGSDFEPLQ